MELLHVRREWNLCGTTYSNMVYTAMHLTVSIAFLIATKRKDLWDVLSAPCLLFFVQPEVPYSFNVPIEFTKSTKPVRNQPFLF